VSVTQRRRLPPQADELALSKNTPLSFTSPISTFLIPARLWAI
jgi:hypothetical protein